MAALPTVIIEFIPDTESGGFTAHIPDIPAYGEGMTEEEALADLKIGVQAFIQENGMEVTIARIHTPSTSRTMNFSELVAYG